MSHEALPAEPVPALRTELLTRLVVEFEAPQDVGATPAGTRRILPMRRGHASGPHLRGQVLPGSGDWVLVRSDGVAQLDIRITLRTEEGALIHLQSQGLLDLPADLRGRILAGEPVDPSQYYFRTTVAFETAAEPYRWLNRIVAVGVGRRTAAGMVTDVFAIR